MLKERTLPFQELEGNDCFIRPKHIEMKKKKSKKPKTKLTQKPENADKEFDSVMKALLRVPKKYNKNNKMEEPSEDKSEKD